MSFKKATKYEAKARLALVGPAKSGKSMTALLIARGIVGPSGRIAAICTEHGSLSKYAHKTDFDVEELTDFSPKQYMRCIAEAEREGYDALIIDSLTHAWAGKGGILQMVDSAASKNKFEAWQVPSALHTELIEAIHSARLHVLATMRAKMAYALETNDRGKLEPRKLGLEPVQREGLEYEFDFVGTLDAEHNMRIGESRIEGFEGRTVYKPGVEIGEEIAAWLAGAKLPLMGKLGDMNGVDLRTASAAALGRYMDAGNHLLEGKHGPKAEALRAHLREVEALFNQRMDEERQAAESGSYLDNTQKED